MGYDYDPQPLWGKIRISVRVQTKEASHSHCHPKSNISSHTAHHKYHNNHYPTAYIRTVPYHTIPYRHIDNTMMRLRPLMHTLARSRVLRMSTPKTMVRPTSLTCGFSTKSSSTAETDLQQKILQRLCWEAYLASGRGSTTLFQSIDVSATGYISREDLLVFLNSVEGKGVNPKAFQILDVLADDHRIDLKEFKSWLIIATKFGRIKNSSYKASLDDHPQLGDRQQSQYSEFSWNEVTMSQGLRRMQYAVRGEVVMKADKLQASGREILSVSIRAMGASLVLPRWITIQHSRDFSSSSSSSCSLDTPTLAIRMRWDKNH